MPHPWTACDEHILGRYRPITVSCGAWSHMQKHKAVWHCDVDSAGGTGTHIGQGICGISQWRGLKSNQRLMEFLENNTTTNSIQYSKCQSSWLRWLWKHQNVKKTQNIQMVFHYSKMASNVVLHMARWLLCHSQVLCRNPSSHSSLMCVILKRHSVENSCSLVAVVTGKVTKIRCIFMQRIPKVQFSYCHINTAVSICMSL